MEAEKIEDLLTIDNIRQVVYFIDKEFNLEIEEIVIKKINDILDGNEIDNNFTKGIIITLKNGKQADLMVEFQNEMIKYFKKVEIIFEKFIRDREAKNLKIVYRTVNKECDDEGKSLQEREQWLNEINERLSLATKEIVKSMMERQQQLIFDNFIIDVITKDGYIDFLKFRNDYVEENVKFVEDFCIFNNIDDKVKNKLISISYVHSHLVGLIINLFKSLIIYETNFGNVVKSKKDWYKKEIGIKPRKYDFFFHLVHNVSKISMTQSDENLIKFLAEYVFYEESKNKEIYQQAKQKQQTLIESTPQQTLSIETTSANAEESKEELTFDNLFPSIEDKKMVMKMLVALKIINSDGTYLSGVGTAMIRVFIDVMKEEGYFVDIRRKPILRVFTPVILGRMVEVINKPSDFYFDTKKRQIIKKLKELIK
jgi:hypothetical protein